MIEIAQECFIKIASKLAQRNTNVKSIYQNSIVKQILEEEEQELISVEDFITGIRSLEIEEFQAIEYACLIKVLAINEEEKFIRLVDLVQILDDCGATENKTKNENKTGKERKQINYETLDEFSMVIMLALSEYLSKSQVSLADLFGNVIFKQTLQSKSKQKQVELIKSSDFFGILNEIGIKTEEKEHDNLKQFLCVSGHAKDKIWVKKLKLAVEDFATNEELRDFAHKCYDALAGEEDNENEPNYKDEVD